MSDLEKAMELLGELEGKIDAAIHELVKAELDNPFKRRAEELDRDIGEIADLIKGVRKRIESLAN
jgi:hypothetical protein